MRKLFWIGLLGLLLFEAANVYFIMPMPGSQRMNSINLAFFLYKWRWFFRVFFGLLLFAGLWKIGLTSRRRWLFFIPLAIAAMFIYMINFSMAADAMFKQPGPLKFASAVNNQVDSNRLVLGVVINGEAKAYPVRFLGYHHHVQDSVGSIPIMVTYCTVCRTGRVFQPMINGKKESFRLVGMDHFNAMLEDATTKSWWRQETGEAITGPLKGQVLPEVFSTQTSLARWLQLNPQSMIMQFDSTFKESYDTSLRYESGKSKGPLTRTDSLSWKDKSWVIGIKSGKHRKAYDWIQLKEVRLITDTIGGTPLFIVLADDDKSFFAFEKPVSVSSVHLNQDTLLLDNHRFRIDGKGIDTSFSLKALPAYQEFWHSWKTFNPATTTFN